MLSSSKRIPGRFTEDEKELSRLIVEISGGDERSLEKLYERTSSLVFGLLLRILSDRQEAEEVLGDVYLQVWEKSRTYQPSLSKPATWILMIARSRAIDKIRSGAKRKEVSSELHENIPSPGNNPEKNSIFGEKRVLIRNALSELNENQKKAIELAYFFGMSQSEIAEEMGKPLGTVKSWIRYGMKTLRNRFTASS